MDAMTSPLLVVETSVLEIYREAPGLGYFVSP